MSEEKTEKSETTLSPEMLNTINTLVQKQVKRLICNFSELELIEYRRKVRKELGFDEIREIVH